MNKIAIIAPEFLNPVWFNKVVSRSFSATVINNAVVVEGETLQLGEQLADGTEVRVYLARQFYAVLESEIKAEETEAARKREAAAEQRRQIWNSRRADAEAFNATINLPVAWRIGEKEVLSGLSASSNGDGCFAKTVQHVELLDDLEAGRLRRRKGDFLCTAKSGSNGNSWSGGNHDIRFIDGDGNKYMPKPSCKQCLKLLERFRKISPESV